MNKWQELARENFGAPYPLGHLNLYEHVIMEELKYCDDQHEALRKLYALIDRIEHLTDVFNNCATKPEHDNSSSQPSL